MPRLPLSGILKHKHPLPFPEPLQRALHRVPQLLLGRVPRPGDLVDGGVGKLALADERQDLLDRPPLAGPVAVRPPAQPEAPEGDVLEDEQARRQAHGLPRHGAVRDHRAALAERPRHGGSRLAADAVEPEEQLVAPAAQRLGQAVPERAVEELPLRQHDRGAEVGELLLQGRRLGLGLALPHDVDAAQAPQPAELDRRAADARVGPVLQEPGAAARRREAAHADVDEVDKVAQHAVRAARVDADGRGLQRGQAGPVDAQEARVGALDQGLRAPGAEPRAGGYGPVALLERRHAVADGHDLEAALVAGQGGRLGGAQERREGGLRAVGALDGVDVGRVDGRGEGADEDGARGQGGGDGVLVDAVGNKTTKPLADTSWGSRRSSSSKKEDREEGRKGGGGNCVPEDVRGFSVLGEDERLGLLVAVRPALVPDGRQRQGAAAAGPRALGAGPEEAVGDGPRGAQGRRHLSSFPGMLADFSDELVVCANKRCGFVSRQCRRRLPCKRNEALGPAPVGMTF
ncbi:uncharacterized protein E0L32_008363 [Thyridium curvatum]|uniref:Uncharacterized protein n=1 Tax=Thyridium curvatum TaxID=1093900 RepID=A0A507B027_9PEZI|nr:uncharacterized protein E0L32_008363 [Thyridium curvatum]TPX10629.1 hypothetical protein E0L32_008363 [Thyridium curvatum]